MYHPELFGLVDGCIRWFGNIFFVGQFLNHTVQRAVVFQAISYVAISRYITRILRVFVRDNQTIQEEFMYVRIAKNVHFYTLLKKYLYCHRLFNYISTRMNTITLQLIHDTWCRSQLHPICRRQLHNKETIDTLIRIVHNTAKISRSIV